jgi:hypothetical protein
MHFRNILTSVVDPHHSDADPGSTYHPDADPDPTFHTDADPDFYLMRVRMRGYLRIRIHNTDFNCNCFLYFTPPPAHAR